MSKQTWSPILATSEIHTGYIGIYVYIYIYMYICRDVYIYIGVIKGLYRDNETIRATLKPAP